jgi:membrane-associated phospholipid phosphatase
MILGIPFFGGHYLIDVIAGVGVTLLSLGIVKAFAARRQLFGLLNRRRALG